MGFKHVIPEMFCKLTSNDEVIVASPDHTRAFCYVDDAVDMTVGLAERTQGLNDTFTLVTKKAKFSIFNLVSLITDVIGAKVDLRRGEETPGSPVRRCPEMHVKHASRPQGIDLFKGWCGENLGMVQRSLQPAS